MDGHGGSGASSYIAAVLDTVFKKAIVATGGDPKKALLQTFDELRSDTEPLNAGSTLSVVYIPRGGRRAYVGILGDSPVAVSTPGQDLWISPEHNVFNPAKVEAVSKRGGYLLGPHFYVSDGEHGLQLSRALGDEDFSQILDRMPEIFGLPIRSGSFILVASDGITDHAPDAKKRIATIIEDLQKSKHPSASAVVEEALRTSHDNVTAIVWRR